MSSNNEAKRMKMSQVLYDNGGKIYICHDMYKNKHWINNENN